MTFMKKAAIALCGVVLILLYLIFLSGSNEYEDHDAAELDREQLFRITEQLLEESEAWPAQLTAEGVEVSSSLEPYPVRAVRYSVEVEGDFEKAIAYVKDEAYSGPGRRDQPHLDKYEVTLYEKDKDGVPYEWVRRSVHIAPPPGGDRDAVVMYFEDRPAPNIYRVAFQSVETIDGKAFPEVEGAVRFKVLPSMYKIVETAPGKVLVRKVEAVDPRGSMSSLMNNHFISLLFFRRFMFEQAQAMQVMLATAG
jgi:hypothetical protein